MFTRRGAPEAYRQFSQTLLGAARNGRPPARLQVEEVAKQCAAWATPEESFYGGLVMRLTGVPDSLRGELDAAAREATAATARLGEFLRRELLPLAREKDACGPEVYARASRYFLGAAVDLAEAYAWSWEEIARLRAEQARVSSLIRPGATREEAVAILDKDRHQNGHPSPSGTTGHTRTASPLTSDATGASPKPAPSHGTGAQEH